MLRPLLALIGAALILAGSQAAADEIYRWIDDGGVVNYTQQKPRGKDAEAITTGSRSTRTEPTTAAEPVTQAVNSDGQPLNAEQQKMFEGLQRAEQARQSEITRIKEQNCLQSQDVLSRLTIKNRIRVRDDSGEYRVMAEDERQDRIQEAQEGIALYCLPA